MSDHVLDRLMDYLEGRLDDGDRAVVSGHLAHCVDCEREFAFASALKRAVEEQTLRHSTPERLVEIADGIGGTQTEAERRHLEMCVSCRDALEWATLHRSPPPIGDEVPVVTPTPRPSRPRVDLSRLCVALVAVATMLVVVPNPFGRDADLGSVAIVEPLPVRMTRDAVAPGSFEESWLHALEKYQAKDYVSAAGEFDRALKRRPGDEHTRLYLGSCELLLQRPEQAIGRMRALVTDATDTRVRVEAQWILANALLLTGAESAARTALNSLAEGVGRRAVEATSLLVELDARQSD